MYFRYFLPHFSIFISFSTALFSFSTIFININIFVTFIFFLHLKIRAPNEPRSPRQPLP